MTKRIKIVATAVLVFLLVLAGVDFYKQMNPTPPTPLSEYHNPNFPEF